jgi:hypothetical protein
MSEPDNFCHAYSPIADALAGSLTVKKDRRPLKSAYPATPRRQGWRLLRNSAASAYFTSARTTDVEMTESARRPRAIILAGGSGLRLYPVTLVVSETIDRYFDNTIVSSSKTHPGVSVINDPRDQYSRVVLT